MSVADSKSWPYAPVLVVGSRGMLARDLLSRLETAGIPAVGLGRSELDITRPEQIRAVLESVAPSVVVNCAAYTAVDQAESEPERAFAVNRDGAANLADACATLSVPLVHISTDYVFDGNAERPYLEDDPVGPTGVYGRSKLEGEESVRRRLGEHLIVRTAWLYGEHGDNFVKTMLRLARERDELRVVADQHGCPTWTDDLAEAIVVLCRKVISDPESTPWGTYHFCGAGRTTRHGFAEAIFEEARRVAPVKLIRVHPIPSACYPTQARRPAYSVLDCDKIRRDFGIVTRPWRESLAEVIQRGKLFREN